MTTYTAITAAQTDADSYIDTALIDALKNNVLAMFEGDASASGVRIQPAALDTTVGVWIELDRQVVSATPSSIDQDNFLDSTYDEYMVSIIGLRPTTDTDHLLIQVGTGATPTYQASNYTYHSSYLGAASALYAATSSQSTTSVRLTTSMGSATSEKSSGYVYVSSPSDATFSTVIKGEMVSKNSGGDAEFSSTAGTWATGTAVTSLKFSLSSGTFAAGTFVLFGRNK